MARVEIYTKFLCPYCARAMALLSAKKAEITEFDVTMGGPKFEEMVARSRGRTTKPQIFIDGHHIGGSDDLAKLDAEGKLDALLAT
jgi:glutaredoxin 3